MIFVKKIEWIDIDTKEADVTLSDNQYELVCFSDEFFGKIGGKFDDMLYAIVDGDVYKSEDNLFLVKHLNNFEYFIIAKIFDKTRNIAQVGECLINTGGGIPNDLENGEFVEFRVRRIDIY